MGKNKDFEKFLYYQLPDGSKVKGVILFDQNGDPLVIGGGSSSVSINQGGNPVGATNPLATGLYSKNQLGNWEAVSPFNALTVRDLGIAGALVNQGTDPNIGQMMLVAGAGWGGARVIPVNLSGQDDTMTLIPVGGVDENVKQKTFALIGDRLKTNIGNATGEFSEANPLQIESSAIGKKNDAVADSDTGTHSIIAMFKRQLQKLTALTALLPSSLGQKTKDNSLAVTIASNQDALATTSTQLPSSLGQKLKTQSLPVVLPLDQTIPVQTDERPSSYCIAITPSNSTGFGGTSRGIYIGTSGDVSAYIGGVSIVFKNCMAGSILPVQATRVDATNTTATNLVAML